MSINDGGPAYPLPVSDTFCASRAKSGYGGMSLRDYFAAQAMPELLRAALYNTDQTHLNTAIVAADAYSMADAMLRARTQDASHE